MRCGVQIVFVHATMSLLVQLWVLGSEVDFQSRPACKNGHTLFNRQASSSWHSLGSEKVKLEYGSGDLQVWPGTDNITFAGQTVSMQLGVAAADTQEPWLCFKQDGILGLAYPSLALVSTTPWFFVWADATGSKRVMSFYLSPHGEQGSTITLGEVDSSHGVGPWMWISLMQYSNRGRRTHAFFAMQILFAERSAYLSKDSSGAFKTMPVAKYVETTSSNTPVIPGVVDTGTSLLLMPANNFEDFEQSLLAAATAQGLDCVKRQFGEIDCPIDVLPALPNITLTVHVTSATEKVAPLQDIILTGLEYTCCNQPCASSGLCAVRVGSLPQTLSTDEWLLGDTFQIAFTTAYDMDRNQVGIRAMSAGTIQPSSKKLPQDHSEMAILWFIIGGVAGGLLLLVGTAFGLRLCRSAPPSSQSSRGNAEGTTTINPLDEPTATVAELSHMDKRHNA